MSCAFTHGVVRLIFIAVLVLVLFVGCDEDAGGPGPESAGEEVWLGTWEDGAAGDHGAILIDITRNGGAVSAEAVIRSRVNRHPFDHLFLRGSVDGGVYDLALDDAKIPYAFEVDISCAVSSGTVSGTFTHPFWGLDAVFECGILEPLETAVDTFIDFDAVVLGLAFDGENLWLPTAGDDHILMDTTGAVVDTVAVFLYPGAHWTSDALTYTGGGMAGAYNVAIQENGQTRNVSDVVEFTRQGEITNRFSLDHAVTGLARDGGEYLSLTTGSDFIHRFDGTGSVLASLPVPVPDLVDIAWDGAGFWAIGWFIKRLYKLDAAGDVAAVYHMPGEGGFILPAGIAFDGARLWYCFGTSYLDSKVYSLTPE